MPTEKQIDLSPLFQPLTIRGMTLRNRFILPAMQRKWCTDGRPEPHLVEYYRRIAAGGTALITTEALMVDHPSATQVPHYGWLTEQTKDGWRECVEAVAAEGASFMPQVFHEGAIRKEGGDGPLAAYPTLSPSGLAAPGTPAGRAATIDEVRDIRDAFIGSALLAEEIGAAGVEVHACHGYLLDQFLWKGTNRRQDEYGGEDIRDRLRIHREIVEGIRAAVSDDFVISFRFSQWKEIDYGAKNFETPEELQTLVSIMEEAGVDLLHPSNRRFWLPEWPDLDPELSITGWTKRFSRVPVAAVGSVGLDTDVMDNLRGAEAHNAGLPSFAEMLRRFERGDFDLIAVGRGQIGDPNWVRKAAEGAITEIRPFTRADLRTHDPSESRVLKLAAGARD
ncbi:MAG: hypothetical protein BGO95_04565 [Micrococcales bacterium 73-13]|nr:MAG: hypothetical protein BGO95_04565 [Micrococcales bacterium 73-13]